MTSKKDNEYNFDNGLAELPDEPKTPHEEVMFVVESTNEIVSKLVEHLGNCCKYCAFREACELEKIDSL